MKPNSTGNAPPSIRSINVRANILSEWTSNQTSYRTEMLRYAAGIALCGVIAAGIVPVSEKSRGEIVGGQRKHEASLAELKVSLAEADRAKKVAEPKVAVAELHAQTTQFFDRMLGELYQVLDSAKSGMAFSSAKVDVRAAEIQIDCRADAESFDIAAAFAEQAGSTPNKVSTVASTRPNGLLAPAGIGFEYFKRVPLQ